MFPGQGRARCKCCPRFSQPHLSESSEKRRSAAARRLLVFGKALTYIWQKSRRRKIRRTGGSPAGQQSHPHARRPQTNPVSENRSPTSSETAGHVAESSSRCERRPFGGMPAPFANAGPVGQHAFLDGIPHFQASDRQKARCSSSVRQTTRLSRRRLPLWTNGLAKGVLLEGDDRQKK